MELLVMPQGIVFCLYSELVPLRNLGTVSIRRGSHVEPNAAGDWFADLSPVEGPRLGPFANRTEALAAEVLWLREHWLLADSRQPLV